MFGKNTFARNKYNAKTVLDIFPDLSCCFCLSKAQMQLAIIKKKQCDAKALEIVEQLLEPDVDSLWLLSNVSIKYRLHLSQRLCVSDRGSNIVVGESNLLRAKV